MGIAKTAYPSGNSMKGSRGTKQQREQIPNPLAAVILERIAEYESRQVPLFDEMSPEELEQTMREIEIWFQQARKRTTRYLSRRAHRQQSNDLDEEMVEDVWWLRFLAVNVARYQQLNREE